MNNIDKARITGAEFEFRALLPAGFELMGGVGYIDSEIRQYDVSPATVGNQLPNITKFKSNLSLQYSADIGDGVGLLVRGDWEHRGKTYFHEGGTAIGVPIRDALDLFNGQIRISLDSGWSASLWGKNLSNKNTTIRWLCPIIISRRGRAATVSTSSRRSERRLIGM